MSQFSYTFDRMRENNPARLTDAAENAADMKDKDYPSASNTRNVCFVPMDGDPVFLNYGYLVRCKHFRKEGKIVLSFTSDTVTLIGIHLDALFFDLMSHVPKHIICKDARYNTVADENPIVNDIEIKTANE